MQKDKEIAVLDFGSQYTHLIARRIRELGVISHIYPSDIAADKLTRAAGIILSGGPRSVLAENKPKHDTKIFELGIPLLGLCYGHQLIAQHFGGRVTSGQSREYGLAKIQISPSPIFSDIPSATTVWMSHGDHVAVPPKNFVAIATSESDPASALACEEKNIYSFQFHPEVHHSEQGKQMLHNFVFSICQATQNWTTETMLAEIEADIIKQAGQKNVFLLISGGVDSTVCYALLEKVLGKERVYGLHIDHGLMRQDETSEVNQALKEIGIDNLHIHQAQAKYMEKLAHVTDPETKRKIIGDLFLDITDKIMREKQMDADQWLLGQGTIYPDTIESGGTDNAELIKTHHNRVPRIKQMIMEKKIIEPIKELYKDEVRKIGEKLGLPPKLLYRHPFPGPGLGIRCLCSDRTDQPPAVKQTSPACSFYRLPIQSVGVQGDERSYAHPAVLTDTNWDELKQISPLITNQHKDINRVLYLLFGDEEGLERSVLWSADLNQDRLDKLRQLDAAVNRHVLNNPACSHVWQMPVVLIPFGHEKKESLVLRPVESEEAMTVAWARLPDDILQDIIKDIKQLNLVDYIFYDVTNKPPGTIEWE